MNKTARCRACDQEILFIKTQKGKTTPVDAKSVLYIPDPKGNRIFVLPDGSIDRGRLADEESEKTRIGYVSHFSTCLQPDRFRKRNKSERTRQSKEA